MKNRFAWIVLAYALLVQQPASAAGCHCFDGAARDSRVDPDFVTRISSPVPRHHYLVTPTGATPPVAQAGVWRDTFRESPA